MKIVVSSDEKNTAEFYEEGLNHTHKLDNI